MINKILIPAILLIPFYLSACAAASPGRQREYFGQMFYTPTEGTVGEHMVSKIRVYESEEPYSCKVTLDAIDQEGTPPPGISREYDKTFFEGTPTQAGDWYVTVIWKGVHCQDGSDQTRYGDRRIVVHFHINPDDQFPL